MNKLMCCTLFGALSFAQAAEPVVIITQPQSVEVPSSSFVRLSVEATGSIDGYTWLNDSGNVVGQTGPSASTLELVSVTPGGKPIGYRVLLTNRTTIVTSEVATVTVRPIVSEPVWKGRLFKKVFGSDTQVPGFPKSYFGIVLPTVSSPSPIPTLSYRDGSLFFLVSRAAMLRWENDTITALVYTNTATPGNVNFLGMAARDQAVFTTTLWSLSSRDPLAASLNTWSEAEGAKPIFDRSTVVPEQSVNFYDFGSCARHGNGIAFMAFWDLPGFPRPAGIYFYNGTNLRRIADETTLLPGVSGTFKPYAFSIGESGTYLNFDGNYIVFSSGGVFKATPQGVITKVADTNDFIPGTTTRFATFDQVDINGGLIFAISNQRAYAFDHNGSVRAMGRASVVSAAGPSMAYYANISTGFYRWNDGTNETIIPSQARFFDESVWQIVQLDAQGDDVAMLIICGSQSNPRSGLYLVSGPPPTSPRPVILVEPLDITVAALNSAGFAVTADGPPPLHFQWLRDGLAIPGATDRTFFVQSTTPTPEHGYSVVVTNNFGSATSRVARLTRTQPGSLYLNSPPFLTTPFIFGSDASITVRAGSTRPLSYQWRKGGVDLLGQTAASLRLTNLNASSRGLYEVFVSDGVTNVTAGIAVDNIIPVITGQSPSAVSSAGASVSFEVAAIGIPPLSYRWIHWIDNNALTVAGATNETLTLTNLTSLDAGDYYVHVVSESKVSQSAFGDLISLIVVNDGPGQSPLLETPTRTLPGIFQFRLVTEALRAYEVQFTPSLAEPTWTTIQKVRGTGQPILIGVPGGTSEGYYRARVIP